MTNPTDEPEKLPTPFIGVGGEAMPTTELQHNSVFELSIPQIGLENNLREEPLQYRRLMTFRSTTSAEGPIFGVTQVIMRDTETDIVDVGLILTSDNSFLLLLVRQDTIYLDEFDAEFEGIVLGVEDGDEIKIANNSNCTSLIIEDFSSSAGSDSYLESDEEEIRKCFAENDMATYAFQTTKVELDEREVRKKIRQQRIARAGKTAVAGVKEDVLTKSSEILVGDKKISIVGKLAESGDYVCESIGPDGKLTRLLIYQSHTQGGMHASQGYQQRPQLRVLKGNDTGLNAQYTQDTMLHPDFVIPTEIENEIRYGEMAHLMAIPPKMPELPQIAMDEFLFDSQQTEDERAKFDAEVTYEPLGSYQLDDILGKMKAGRLTREKAFRIAEDLDDFPYAAVMKYVEKINSALDSADIIPDFNNEPKRTYEMRHRYLGKSVVRVYQEKGIEWHIAEDNAPQPNVWINSIRKADSPATSYGTDSIIIKSGILTTKPLEYPGQCTAIPSRYQKSDGDYALITPFIAEFLPIKRYLEARRG